VYLSAGSEPPKEDEEERAARKGDRGVSVAGRQWHDIRLPPTWESNSAQIGLGTGQGASTRASAGGAVEELEVSGHGPSAEAFSSQWTRLIAEKWQVERERASD
jgi:hypothetical protein